MSEERGKIIDENELTAISRLLQMINHNLMVLIEVNSVNLTEDKKEKINSNIKPKMEMLKESLNNPNSFSSSVIQSID